MPTARKPPEVVLLLEEVRTRVKNIKTLQDWHVAIARMRSLSVKHSLGLHSPHVNIIDLPDGSVGQIGQNTVRTVKAAETRKVWDEYRGPCIIYPEDPDNHVPLSSVGYLIRNEYLPVMIIDLSASDTHILEEVKRELNSRDRSMAIPRTTGRYSLSRSLCDGYAFDRWLRFHIVELTELIAWRAKDPSGRRKYPNHLLGSWIDSQFFTPKTTSEAFKIIREAIDALQAIMAEAAKNELSSQPE